MGIKKFNKVFSPEKEITFNELKGKTIAIDAMIEIYRSILGISHNKKMLTDPKGKTTIHLMVINSLILNLYKAKVNQIWVFDFDIRKSIRKDKGNTCKQHELKIRQDKRKKAQEEINIISNEIEDLEKKKR